MTNIRHLLCAGLVAAATAAPVLAQTVPPAAPVQSQPLPPLPSAPTAPSAPSAPAAPAPAAPAPASPAPASPVGPSASPVVPPSGGLATLAPPPADPSVPDEVQLTPRPSTTMQGQSSWDDGYETLTKTFETLKSETAKAGIRATGLPLATFVETDDMGFRFEAQIPVESVPATRPPGLAPGVNFGQTPGGRAIRFTHRSPYDDIDSTYEAISAYLDSKGIEVKEAFTEEYVNPGANAGDPALEIYIYVQPK
ncbi:GyrI-like domain-containing protein [Alsobacter sp. R-9]